MVRTPRSEFRWTDKDVDELFMLDRLPTYHSIHVQGKRGKKNKEKNAFLRGVHDDYRSTFPGRMETWNLSEIGLGGAPEVRDRKEIQVSLACSIEVYDLLTFIFSVSKTGLIIT